MYGRKRNEDFVTTLILSLCCKTPSGLLWAIKCVKTLFYMFTLTKEKLAVWPAKMCLEQVRKAAPGLLFRDVSVRSRVRSSLLVGRAGAAPEARAAACELWARHAREGFPEPGPPGLPRHLPCL